MIINYTKKPLNSVLSTLLVISLLIDHVQRVLEHVGTRAKGSLHMLHRMVDLLQRTVFILSFSGNGLIQLSCLGSIS